MTKKQSEQRTSAEFTRFREFTKCLLAVPKKEIDRQKAEYERKKSNKTKRAAK